MANQTTKTFTRVTFKTGRKVDSRDVLPSCVAAVVAEWTRYGSKVVSMVEVSKTVFVPSQDEQATLDANNNDCYFDDVRGLVMWRKP